MLKGEERSDLLVGLAKIEEQIKQVNTRLDKLNGTVADIIIDVAVVKAAAVKHPFECGYGPKILEIERRLETGDVHGAINVERELAAYHLVEADTGYDTLIGDVFIGEEFARHPVVLAYWQSLLLYRSEMRSFTVSPTSESFQ